jgi:hypothetical protein
MLINIAVNVFAASYLFGYALLALLILGVIGYFSYIALRLRIRTIFWTPAVGDKVRPRRFSNTIGTIEKIKGSKLWVGYYSPNNLAKQEQQFERKDLFFEHRPAPRRSA